ncbi:enoyl-CoA hydratase/isomerase family protein [Wenyingzhuangia sp. IMCC45574]
MTTAYVTSTVKNKIAEIEFFNPASNSLNSEQLKELSQAILEAGTNNAVHLIHLKSAGTRAFCAGASFDELLQIEDLENGTQFFMGFANVINAIRTCGKLVVTSIQGKTVGGGVGIAAASDYVLATEAASIKLSELSIGIGPFVIEPVVSKKIGLNNMAALSLNPTGWKNAVWAEDKGLYNVVCANIETLEEQVAVYVNELSSYNPKALHEMKKVLWQGTENWNDLLKERAAVSGKLVLSKETKAALSKFKNK